MPGKFWLDEQFQDELHLGMRKQRSDIVHDVATRYEKIFGILDPKFTERSERSSLPEVKSLLETFLHIGEEDEDGELDLSKFFRDDCLVRVLRLLLSGPSVIRNGHRSPKARKSHAQMWHVKEITPSLLAFGAVVIKFVLSGEETFEEVGESVNWTEWFLGRLKILEGVYDSDPDAYNDLMAFHNHAVFPHFHRKDAGGDQPAEPCRADNVGLSEKDEAFLQRLKGKN